MTTKILFLIQYGKEGGGINKTLLTQLTHMDRSRFTPYALVAEDGPIVETLRPYVEAIQVIPVPHTILYKRREAVKYDLSAGVDLMKLIPFLLQSARFIRQAGINVIHCNNLKTNFLGVILSKICRVPVICHIRSATPLGFMGKVYIWGATSIISVSHGAQQASLGTGAKSDKPSDKCRVIYNGRDLQEFSPAHLPPPTMRQLLGLKEDSIVVAIIGGLIRWKGHLTFLKAAKQVFMYEPLNIEFLIVGNADFEDAEYESELKALAHELDIQESVIFTGYRKDIPNIYATLDILVSASWYEALGGVMLEAMAAGKPVIGTRAAGTPEIVIDQETGLLVPVKDANAMATAIYTLAQDPGLRAKMGRSSRQRAEAQFSVDGYIENMQQEYQRVAK